MKSPNFHFLKQDAHLLRLASEAEALCLDSPDLSLTRMRQLMECVLADLTTHGSLAQRIDDLAHSNTISRQMADAMHRLRRLGNTATHEAIGTPSEALLGLQIARAIAIWKHKLTNRNFKPTPFVPPQPTVNHSAQLKQEVDSLNEKLAAQQKATLAARKLAVDSIKARKTLEEEARAQYEDLQAALQLAEETEEKLAEAQSQFLAAADENETKALNAESIAEAEKLFNNEIDEATTRRLIDQQLIDAGWRADSVNLRHAKGAKPKHGVNQAIAEYPTSSGPADYVLFIGLTPVAAVEAKRQNIDVAGKIPQAERYSRTFKQAANAEPAYSLAKRTVAWPDDAEGHYHLPFVYSCNGNPYVKQLREKSGTWFRDVRRPSNLSKPLPSFHTPAGLLDLLKRDFDEANKHLKNEGFGYLKLRDYQIKAIKAVEETLEAQPTQANGDPTNCLLAMATGTGKTRTIIGLIYRFLKAERFKRILFLVDRTSLGTQALEAFQEAPLEQNQTLSTIYNVAELGDMAAEAEDRIQVATVQAMVQRIFNSDKAPNIDTYDCIIVDEAHRGYTLDQEMTDGALVHRDPAKYLSSYRRVLDYFDAVKVGLTATPAKHTTEIFGKPVYTYSYREAVADDWLIDHEPPISYETELNKNGIQFKKGDEVSVVNANTKNVELALLEDDLHYDVESFNRRVITEPFNKIICKELAKQFEPNGDEKVMIFCATDIHADMVKRLLDEEFKDLYGDSYNELAVRKITGKSDQVDKLIKRYKNERLPSIAITVDLLTTGIDVPKICHLVFLRRVRSRILYEQMIGRATRRCDEIGKTTFKIYDAVDIYKSLEQVSSMKPLVKRANIPLSQLIAELKNPNTHTSITTEQDTSQAYNSSADTYSHPAPHSSGDSDDTRSSSSDHAHDVLNEINQKLMRVFRKAEKKAERDDELKQKLDELEENLGVAPAELHTHLRELGPVEAANFLTKHTALERHIGLIQKHIGTEQFPIISDQEDTLIGVRQDPAGYNTPEDYLESFTKWLEENVNESAALSACVTAPKDLTRAQLKEVKLLLDQHGYSKANLAAAWRNKTNQEIAASIIGYIRQAALGEPLISFEDRVKNAMTHIYSLTLWTPVQKKWLERLAKQLTHEVVIDQDFVNQAFADDGGAARLNGLLGKKLDEVLDTLSENLWGA